MKILLGSLAMFFCTTVTGFSQDKAVIDQAALSQIVKVQAEKMGRLFIQGEYKSFSKYTYPKILNMIGGETKMAALLIKTAEDMKSQGMTFSNVTFSEVSKIIKNGNELQCTIPQHIEIKLSDGRLIVTSTLIALSTDKGADWTFVDTSNKDLATLRKILPNLSNAIIIPPQQPPVRYSQ